MYANFCSDKLVAYSVLLIGYGMFGDLMHLVDQYRWMRKMRYFGKHNTEENILRGKHGLPISQLNLYLHNIQTDHIINITCKSRPRARSTGYNVM